MCKIYREILKMLLKLTDLCAKMGVGGEQACIVPHLDLIRAPYALYGVKYIDLVTLWECCSN